MPPLFINASYNVIMHLKGKHRCSVTGLGHTLSHFFCRTKFSYFIKKILLPLSRKPCREIFLSGPELSDFKNTAPGRWTGCKSEMVHISYSLQSSFDGLLLKKCSLQLYMDTRVEPSNDPTNCGTFTEEERETQLAISSRLPIFVLKDLCFSKPKHQSGTNFVSPTGRNETVISLCWPVSTRHIR